MLKHVMKQLYLWTARWPVEVFITFGCLGYIALLELVAGAFS
jgi:hypothetical protein